MKLPIDYTSAHWTERKQAREDYIKIQKGLCRDIVTGKQIGRAHV